MTTTEDAARATGIPADHIADIDEATEGLVVTTNDGARYVLVPGDKPDKDGKTGLMYLAKPDPDRSYSFPVYTPHDIEEAAEIAKPKRGKAKVDVTAPGDAEPVIAEVPEATPEVNADTGTVN